MFQIERAVVSAEELFLFGRLAVEIDQVVESSGKQTGENPRVKIGTQAGIVPVPLCAPAVVLLEFGANQPRNLSWVPSQGQKDTHNPFDVRGPQ